MVREMAILRGPHRKSRNAESMTADTGMFRKRSGRGLTGRVCVIRRSVSDRPLNDGRTWRRIGAEDRACHRPKVRTRVRLGVLIVVCVLVLISGVAIVSKMDGERRPNQSTALAVETPMRVYIGSISNDSFRVAWLTGAGGHTGYIKWGPEPESWATYTSTDLRAIGSLSYQSPSQVHLVQTDNGSGQKMLPSTVYWFKVFSNGIEYGDSAESDTIYGYANCVDLGVSQPGRPWGILTTGLGLTSQYNITGYVEGPPPLSREYKNDALVLARVNDGSGDSLPLLDVTRSIGGQNGGYDIDIGEARRTDDGGPYNPSEGATIKLLFDNGMWGGCPVQSQWNFPNWTYDQDQVVIGLSPLTLHDHIMWFWSDDIPEMSGVATAVVPVVMMCAIMAFRRLSTGDASVLSPRKGIREENGEDQ